MWIFRAVGLVELTVLSIGSFHMIIFRLSGHETLLRNPDEPPSFLGWISVNLELERGKETRRDIKGDAMRRVLSLRFPMLERPFIRARQTRCCPF